MPILYGIIAGIFTGLGMGGGTILILQLSLFMNLEQHIAQATNLIFFIPTAFSAIIVNVKQKNVDKKVALIISMFGILGAIVGATLSKNISSESLKKYYAIFIFLIAVHEIYVIYKGYNTNKNKT